MKHGLQALLLALPFISCAMMAWRVEWVQRHYVKAPQFKVGDFVSVDGDDLVPAKVTEIHYRESGGERFFLYAIERFDTERSQAYDDFAAEIQLAASATAEAEFAKRERFAEKRAGDFQAERDAQIASGQGVLIQGDELGRTTITTGDERVVVQRTGGRRLHEHHLRVGDNGIEVGNGHYHFFGDDIVIRWTDADTGETVLAPGPGDEVIEILTPPTDVKPLSPELYPWEEPG